VDNKDGPEGRLLRYGALFGAMSLVAQLGAEDAAEFVVARDGIASLIETLQRRHFDKVGSKLGLSPLSQIKDPVVSKTKGAPRKGRSGRSYVDHGSHDPAAPSATRQPHHCHTNQGMQSQSGDPCDTLPAHGAGMTPPFTHGGSSPFCLNPVGVGGGGTNFFLGGQHIEQFYTTQGCSGHIAQPSAHAASPSLGNPNAWTNEELFE
ncbi:hypothetical protein S245_037074, partial [Arachis hypogaea]